MRDDPSDIRIEECVEGMSKSDSASIPSFDDILSRQPQRKPLLNGRNSALLALSVLLATTFWWLSADDPTTDRIGKDSTSLEVEKPFDFEGYFAVIDDHFHRNDTLQRFPVWATPSDTLLTMNVQTYGVQSHVE